MPLPHPDIDWAGTDAPRSPADPVVTGSFGLIIIHNGNITPIPVQPASALAPDAAVGYSTSG